VIVLLAGAQLHALFWPSLIDSLLTTTSVLRFCAALAIIIGGILALRRITE
jgi:preprotein translocase subunit SecE